MTWSCSVFAWVSYCDLTISTNCCDSLGFQDLLNSIGWVRDWSLARAASSLYRMEYRNVFLLMSADGRSLCGSRLSIDVKLWCRQTTVDCTRCCRCLHASACHASRRDEWLWQALSEFAQSSTSVCPDAAHHRCIELSAACWGQNRFGEIWSVCNRTSA